MDSSNLEEMKKLSISDAGHPCIPFCDYMFIKGMKKGQRCTDFGKYQGRCCKHKRKASPEPKESSNIEDIVKSKKSPKQKAVENTNKLRDDEIFNDNVRESANLDGPDPKSSVWNITINSNTDYDKMPAADRKKFKRFIDYIFDENGIFDFLTDMNSPDDPTANIENMHSDYYFENSSKNLLHCHGILRLKHHGHYKLEVNKIRSLAKQMFGKNIHLDAPVTSDYVGSWENYMSKMGVRGKLDF